MSNFRTISLYVAIAFVSIGAALFLVLNTAQAAGPFQLNGAAWSDMPNMVDECRVNPVTPITTLNCFSTVAGGITMSSGRGAGWISMRGVAQNSTPYGVTIDSTGSFYGQGWSENMGWMNFDATGCPSGPCRATVNLTTGGKVTGWAKMTAGVGNMAGGWDGWVKMSGTAQNNTPYGVTLTIDEVTGKGTFSGYAWGDDIMGWIDFKRVTVQVDPEIPQTPDLSLTASSTSVCPEEDIDLFWSTPSGTVFTSCTASSAPSVAQWNGALPANELPTVAQHVRPEVKVLPPSTSYKLTCTTATGTSLTASVVVKVNKTCEPGDDDDDDDDDNDDNDDNDDDTTGNPIPTFEEI